MRSRVRGVLCGFLIVALAGAVGAEEAIELVDQTGEAVRIDRPVERLVSVYGSGTYIVYTLGAADRLILGWYIGVKGIDKASEAMLRLEPRLEQLLTFGEPNVEEIVSHAPDLILVDGSRHAAFADQMTDLGIPVIRYLVESPAALVEAVLLTGQALGPEAAQRAAAFVADYERLFAAVAADLEALPADRRARVLFLGTDRLRVASGEMYQTDLIEAAGAVSVTSGLSGYWNEVTLEQILVWNPDVILIPPYGPLQPVDLLKNPDWASIRAVQDGRVHRMPRVIAPMDTPVPESLLGVVWMAKRFYPDRIGLDLAHEAERFYAHYYGYELTDAEQEHLSVR